MLKNYSLKLFLLSLILLFSLQSNAQVTKAVANGNWSSAATWDNGVPNNNLRAIISKGFTVTIDNNHEAKEVVVHGVLNVKETGTGERSLTTRWMHINSDGMFSIGSETNAFDRQNFTLTLTGTDPDSDQIVPMANGFNMTITKNDGFLMAAGGGRLQFFGKNKLSFTKLSATAEIGSTSINVANIIDRDHDGTLSADKDGAVNWEVGDEIVIASSSVDYAEEEVRTITAIQNQGTNYKLTLNRPLTYRHFGEIETYGINIDPKSTRPIGGPRSIDMRAEVALLSRNVKIQGLASQDTDVVFGDREKLIIGSDKKAENGVGGHIMIMPTAGQISVEGVQLHLMGQSGNLGRYPFHWHVARDRSGDVFRNSSITNSNNRGVVVHTTNNIVVEGIVAHDVHGHCFFTEDGVEINNKFINNIAFGIHRVANDAKHGRAFTIDDTDRFFDRTDRSRTTAAFWIANAGNVYRGNVVAGSQGSGYWFAQHFLARGVAANIPEYDDYEPLAIPVLEFNHNSVHSTITGFVIAGPPGTPAGISVGEFGENINHFGNVDPLFNNLTIYQTRVGLYPLVSNITSIFDGFRAADNHVTNHDSDPTLIKNALMVGRSKGNPYTKDTTNGNRLYHGHTIIENTHIAGFKSSSFWVIWGGNRVRSGFETEKITFEDDNSISLVTRASPANYATVRDVYDRDGSLTAAFGGGAGFSLIPNNEWCRDAKHDVNSPRLGDWKWIISKQRFATLQSQRTRSSDPYINPNILVTSPNGVVIPFNTEAGDRDHNRFGVRFNFDNEYRFDFVDGGIDFETERLRLTLSQWSLPSNSVGVVLRLKDMAKVLKGKDVSTVKLVPYVNSLQELRNSKKDAQYIDGNDLVFKMMNRGNGIHGQFVDFVDINEVINQKPNLFFVTPTNNQEFDKEAEIQVSVNASDNDGSVSIVKLFLDGVQLRDEFQPPYEWNSPGQDDNELNNLPTGVHELKAIVTDNLGGETTETINIIVNEKPNLLFTKPTNNQVFNIDDKIHTIVNASDNDGSVSIVKLFLNGVQLRDEFQPPYEWNGPGQNDDGELSNLPEGVYTLRAVARDNLGGETEETINIIVKEGTLSTDELITNSIKLYPNPVGNNQTVTLTNPNSIALKEFAVYDLTGRKILIHRLEEITTNYNFDLSGLASGNYLIIIQSDHGTITKKLLKE